MSDGLGVAALRDDAFVCEDRGAPTQVRHHTLFDSRVQKDNHPGCSQHSGAFDVRL
jgi:hypothetical protein